MTTLATKFWHKIDDDRIQCDLCPRHCKLHEGQQGLCFIRENQNGEIVLTSYGRSSGFCIDPVEKKPLNHFLPGTPVLSFGTAGCNLACKFCQNWDISKSRKVDALADLATPQNIANAASQHQCRSVAYTYNDPVIFHEYAIDVAQACREYNIKSIAVSAGYVCSEPREEFYQYMDAANIDLKSFNEKFYYKLTGAHLEPVLDTLKYIKHETNTWLEITTLIIPGENDSDKEIHNLSEWVVSELGPDVPLHFSAFHPDWKMTNIPGTPSSTLLKARKIATNNGLNYVYVGNVHNEDASSTYCPGCGTKLIGRDWYILTHWNLVNQRCPECNTLIEGVFEDQPGNWGSKRLPVQISQYC